MEKATRFSSNSSPSPGNETVVTKAVSSRQAHGTDNGQRTPGSVHIFPQPGFQLFQSQAGEHLQHIKGTQSEEVGFHHHSGNGAGTAEDADILAIQCLLAPLEVSGGYALCLEAGQTPADGLIDLVRVLGLARPKMSAI